jgi:hypothetical protein
MNIKKGIKKNTYFIVALLIWLVLFTVCRKAFGNNYSFIVSSTFYIAFTILMVGNIVYLSLKSEK